MSESATAQRQAVQVEYLDPKTLILDRNVRFDPRLDKDFIGSIKERGVLVPIVAVRTADGGIKVRLGARRTLGAIEAEQADVPVMVVADERTDDAGEIDRIIEQWSENHHREPMSELEDVGVVAQLLDLGLTAGQIQRRTRMRKHTVDAAVAIAGSELAKVAQARYEFLSLEQAAAIASFENNPEAVKLLVAAAQIGEVRFDHVVSRLRQERADRKAKDEARQGLEATGVTVVDDTPWDHGLDYLTDAEGNELTEEPHRSCPGHAAVLAWSDGEGSDGSWVAEAVCTAPTEHGHISKISPPRPAGTEPGDAAGTDSGQLADEVAEAKRAERRKVIENNRSWRAAEDVRRQWLTQLLARKSPPKGAQRYVLAEFARAHWRLCTKIGQGHQLGCQLLGLESPSHDTLFDAMTTASDGRAQVLALAVVLGAYEDHTSTETWRSPTPQDRDYLAKLVEWGYQLSDIEAGVLGETQAD